MFCSKCGANFNENTRFCPQCGAAVSQAPTQPEQPPKSKSSKKKWIMLASVAVVAVAAGVLLMLLLGGGNDYQRIYKALLNTVRMESAEITAHDVYDNDYETASFCIDGDNGYISYDNRYLYGKYGGKFFEYDERRDEGMFAKLDEHPEYNQILSAADAAAGVLTGKTELKPAVKSALFAYFPLMNGFSLFDRDLNRYSEELGVKDSLNRAYLERLLAMTREEYEALSENDRESADYSAIYAMSSQVCSKVREVLSATDWRSIAITADDGYVVELTQTVADWQSERVKSWLEELNPYSSIFSTQTKFKGLDEVTRGSKAIFTGAFSEDGTFILTIEIVNTPSEHTSAKADAEWEKQREKIKRQIEKLDQAQAKMDQAIDILFEKLQDEEWMNQSCSITKSEDGEEDVYNLTIRPKRFLSNALKEIKAYLDEEAAEYLVERINRKVGSDPIKLQVTIADGKITRVKSAQREFEANLEYYKGKLSEIQIVYNGYRTIEISFDNVDAIKFDKAYMEDILAVCEEKELD